MDELFINGLKADLDETIPFPINYSIADIKNPENRKRSASKATKLPGTQNNLNIFSATNSLSVVVDNQQTSSAVSFDPTARVEGKYYKSGLLIFDGLVKLDSVTLQDGYWQFEIILFSNIVNVIKKLGEVMTNELRWSDYRHPLSQVVVRKSWDEWVLIGADLDGTGGTETDNFSGTPTTNFANGLPDAFGYVYPVGDFGYQRDAWNWFKTNDLVPHVYVKEVIDRMLALPDINLSYTSNFMNTPMFRKLIFGMGGGDKVGLGDDEILRRRVEVQGATSYDFTISGSPWNGAQQGEWVFNFDTFGLNTQIEPFITPPANVITNLAGQYSLGTGFITVQQTGNYRVTRTAVVGARREIGDMTFALGGEGLSQCFMRAYANGQPIQTLTSTSLQIPTSPDTFTYVDMSNSAEMFLFSGQILKFEFQCQTNQIRTNGDLEDITFRFDCDDIRIKLESIDTILQENNPVEVSRFVPPMKCSDFFKGIITAFNLYVSDPDLDGVVRIEPLDEYFSPSNEYDDWTDKVDYSKAFKIRPAATIEGKLYRYKFQNQADYFNKLYTDQFGENYGDKNIEVASPFNVGERVFELPFGQSVPVALGDDTPPAADYQPNMVVPAIFDFDVNTGAKKPYKGKPRIYFYSGMRPLDSEIGGWFLSSANNSNEIEYFAYPCANHFDDIDNPTIDLNFSLPRLLYWTWIAITGRNLWAYHGKFFEELTSNSSAIVECYVRLLGADIFQMDFGRLKMIDGVLYRLNEIKDWDENNYASTKVELLKVVPAVAPNQGGIFLPPEPFILQEEDVDGTAFVLNQNGEPILYNI